MNSPEQTEMFGGPWTEKKLKAVTNYLKSYKIALKRQRFKLYYIDAFAGTGYRARPEIGHKARGLFPVEDKDKFAEGSVLRALAITPPFDQYYFIERNKGRFEKLKTLADAFPQHMERMVFLNRDANEAVIEICETTDWRTTRAVLFLDPYGMQVEWTTLEAIAHTEAIDLWLLFPIGMVNRLAPKIGPKPEFSKVLDRVFGDHGWFDVIYRKVEQEGFFDSGRRFQKVCSNADIESYFRGRLNVIFQGGVSEQSLPLCNRRQSCMYLLMFACGNPSPKAFELAHKMADYILQAASRAGRG